MSKSTVFGADSVVPRIRHSACQNRPFSVLTSWCLESDTLQFYVPCQNRPFSVLTRDTSNQTLCIFLSLSKSTVFGADPVVLRIRHAAFSCPCQNRPFSVLTPWRLESDTLQKNVHVKIDRFSVLTPWCFESDTLHFHVHVKIDRFRY